MTSANPSPLCLSVGSRIDNLQIVRVLGQGSSGFSYLISDRMRSGEFVLKEYLPAALQPHISRRPDDGFLQFENDSAAAEFRSGMQDFMSQGRILAGLQHANIMPVVRCFEARGTAWLQMPWYPGATLSQLQHPNDSAGRSLGATQNAKLGAKLGAAEIQALLPPLLDALQYLHQHSITHQDIKPANIYITSSGIPMLLDFGAATQAQHTNSRRMGSPGYAAPEQELGTGPVGPWTDVYGLAATLYRLISGTVPIAAQRRLQAIQQGQPDPLAALDETAIREFPTGWLAALQQGLNLQAEKRPRSIAEWSRNFFGPETRSRRSVLASTPGATDSAPQYATEGRAWLPMILLGLFVLGLGVLVFYLVKDDSGIDATPEQQASGETVEPGNPSAPTDIRNPEQNRRWQEALEADTIYAYQRYMQDFPNSLQQADALQHLARLDDELWQSVDAEGSRSAYESYLQQLPKGLHEAEAMIRLDVLDRTAAEAERQQTVRQQQDNLAWNRARMQRSVAAIDQYLAEFPDGQHLSAAQSLRRELSDAANDSTAFAAAQKLNNRKSYQAYIDAFPRGQHVTAALTAIDGLTLRPGKRFRDCDHCPDLVVLEAGSFWQGAEAASTSSLANEKPQRKVVLNQDFAIGIHEVTLAQWDACVSGGGCSATTDNGWGRGSRPVIMVSWNDAQAYVEWLSKTTGERYRLPSESEWEFAARAGETAEWPDDDPAGVCGLANIAGSETGFRWAHTACADPFSLETAPVGSFLPNAFGLYDYLGNVAEWTLDCMSLSYVDAPADGSANNRGLCNSRVTRGGSWFSGARESRLTARFNLKAGDRNDFTGFRVVRELPASS